MNAFIEDLIFENENLHIIGYKNKFAIGYELTDKKAFFRTEYFESDLLGEMPDNYQIWATELIKKLNCSLILIDTKYKYYNVFNLHKTELWIY